ncbi:MAG: hypothetical protein RIR86_1079, partial [Acidobacteriota bacterium]
MIGEGAPGIRVVTPSAMIMAPLGG